MLDTSYLNISNFTECKNFNLGQSYVFFHIITRVFINSEKCATLQVYCQGNKKALKLYWTIKHTITYLPIQLNFATVWLTRVRNVYWLLGVTCDIIKQAAPRLMTQRRHLRRRRPRRCEFSVWVHTYLRVKHISVTACVNLVWDYPLVGFCLIYWFQTVN